MGDLGRLTDSLHPAVVDVFAPLEANGALARRVRVLLSGLCVWFQREGGRACGGKRARG